VFSFFHAFAIAIIPLDQIRRRKKKERKKRKGGRKLEMICPIGETVEEGKTGGSYSFTGARRGGGGKEKWRWSGREISTGPNLLICSDVSEEKKKKKKTEKGGTLQKPDPAVLSGII